MPSRVIRGEINSSDSLSQVSPEAELAFRALLHAVDDYGRCDARPAALKAALFPMRSGFTAKKVRALIDELSALPDPPVRSYSHNGREYLWLPKFEKHRSGGRRAAESKYPKPPEIDPQEILGNPRNSEEILPSSEKRVASSEKRVAEHSAPRGAHTRSPETECPESLTPEQFEALRAWCSEKYPTLVTELPAIWDRCISWARATGVLRRNWYAQMQTLVNSRAAEGPRHVMQMRGQAMPAPVSRIRPEDFHKKEEISF